MLRSGKATSEILRSIVSSRLVRDMKFCGTNEDAHTTIGAVLEPDKSLPPFLIQEKMHLHVFNTSAAYAMLDNESIQKAMARTLDILHRNFSHLVDIHWIDSACRENVS